MYREGRYGQALGFYTEALSVAKTKPQRIALHSNRAACHLKLHDFQKVRFSFPVSFLSYSKKRDFFLFLISTLATRFLFFFSLLEKKILVD